MLNSDTEQRLYLIATSHEDHQIRLNAGMILLENASENGITVELAYCRLYKMAINPELPYEIRKLAGLDMVIKAESSDSFSAYTNQLKNCIAKNADMPIEVREAAAEAFIGHFNSCSDISVNVLVELSSESDLPFKSRELAGNRLIEILSAKNKFLDLIKLSENANIPPEVRINAGLNAVEKYLTKEDQPMLVSITRNIKLPGKVIEAARRGLGTLAEKFVREGILSRGTVAAPHQHVVIVRVEKIARS